MSEKPILFNDEMVRAILDGHKTQTRRIVKPQLGDVRIDGVPQDRWDLFISPLTGWIYYGDIMRQLTIDGKPVRAPVRRRDILYVREAWIENNNPNSENCGGYEYHADYDGALCQSLIKWHPSIFMPKKAARIFLQVTDVHVERLQKITVDDIAKEGLAVEPPPICRQSEPTEEQRIRFERLDPEGKKEYIQTLARHKYMGWCQYADDMFKKWKTLWDSTLKQKDRDQYGWAANPWVWVICFELLGKEDAE